jgi:hypothetical protein
VRKLRLSVAAALALCLAAAATADANTYDFTAKVPSGGSKAKPKPASFTFDFAVGDPAANLPAPVKAYTFTIAGLKLNASAVKAKCTAAKINAAGSDKGCPAKAVVGSGTVSALVGIAGTPQAGAAGSCTLKMTAYAAGGKNVALFLAGGSGAPGATPCLVPISQAIAAKWAPGAAGLSLSFQVPDPLRHQVGLDVPVLSVKSQWKAAGGYLQSVGCKGQRSATATFTDEQGGRTPVTKPVGAC